jgi:putative transposase
MPRKARIEFPGAVYHLLDRGDRREAIFVDEEDRLAFLRTLEEVCRRTGWWVHAYVLMSNHYHLLRGDAGGEPGGRNEMVPEHLHDAL